VNHQTENINHDRTTSLWTIPNALCFIRLVGSPLLLVTAYRNQSQFFLGLFLFLLMTDWFDGKLAILLNQRSVYGARLDSFADGMLYGCTLLGLGWLKWELIERDFVWVLVGLGSYVLTSLAGLIKFGRLPSYHTRAAKICWLLAGLATVALLMDWSPWFFRTAVLGVTYTNLEATLMTITLSEWTSDLSHFGEALRRERERKSERPQERNNR